MGPLRLRPVGERQDQPRETWAGRVLYPAVLVVLALSLYLPLLRPEGLKTDEDVAPYLRTLEYLGAVRAGHLPPQSYPDLFSGAGYAFPRFYPPLGTVAAAMLTALSGDVVAGVNLAFLASVILSGLTLYRFLLSVTGNRLASLIGGIAYIGFPYRFQDVFVRGALAECWSFVWYPLILLGTWRLQEERRLPWYLPVAVGALLLSHPQMTLYFAVVCAILAAVWRPLPSRAVLLRGGYAAAIALGLTAWYWLPHQHYLPTVRASNPSLVWADVGFVEQQRVAPLTLVTGRPTRRALSLTVGWLALGTNLLVAGAWLLPKGVRQDRLLLRRAQWLLVPWWVLLGFTIAPGVALRHLPTSFVYIQFPWRVLGLMGFLTASSFALLLAAWKSPRVTVAGLGLVLVSLVTAGVWPVVKPDWTASTLAAMLSPPGPPRGLDTASEYLPLTLPGFRQDSALVIANLNRRLELGARASPGVLLRSYSRSGSRGEVVVDTRDSGAVVLPLIYYDFYSAHGSDGARLKLRDSLGLVAFTASPGRQVVVLEERLTPAYWVGIGIVAVTTLVCGALLAWQARRGSS